MTRPESPIPPEALLEHAGFLRALARGLLRDEHAGEDVVQSTWLAALERPTEGVRNPRAFLATVAGRFALKQSRSEGRRTSRERAGARPEALPATDELVEREHTLRSVTDAVLALDEPWRATILARHYEGLEAREIAAREGLPVGTVRSRIARGHELLRERLDREHGGERQAWSLGLAHFAGLERAGPVGAGVGASGGVAGGALIVSTQVKTIGIALCVLAALAGLWFGASALLHETPGEFVASAAVRVPPDAGGDAAQTGGAESLAVADARSAAPASATTAQPEPPSTGSLRVRARWWDGAPAAEVVVKLHHFDPSRAPLPDVYLRTDEQGELLVEAQEPGTVGLYPQHGGFASAVVEVAFETPLDLTLRKGIGVSGRVVDLEGNPVPYAEIWLSDSGNGSRGVAVGSADAGGRFELRDVSDQNSICARKAGHAPSPSFWLRGAPGDEREIDLVLQGVGAGLALRVVGPDGAPVEGARVRLVPEDFVVKGYDAGRPAGTSLGRPIPYLLTTDSQGLCEAPSLLAGSAEIQIGCETLAPWTGVRDLPEGRRSQLTVALSEGVHVRGTVRSTGGEPIEGASVRVGDYGVLARGVTSAQDGSFELAALAPGSFEIEAKLEDLGSDVATLSGIDGQELTWDAVIDAGRTLSGRLLDEHGEALGGWRVHVGAGRHGWDGPPSFRASTDSAQDGRFRVINCPDGNLWVHVSRDRRGDVFPAAQWEDALANGVEREFVVPRAAHPSAFLSGRVVGTDGRGTSAKIELRHPARERMHVEWSQAESGAFKIGPLPPETYSLEVEDPQAETRAVLEDLQLGAGADLDLGELRLGGPGRLELALSASEGVDLGQVTLVVSKAPPFNHFVARLRAVEAHEGLELPAGIYELEVTGLVARRSTPFVVRSGATTRLEVELEQGAEVLLRFQLPAGRELPIDLELLFRADDGTELRRVAYLRDQEGQPEEYALWYITTVDSKDGYSLEVNGPDGLSGSGYVDAARLAAGADPFLQQPLDVVLR